MGYDIRDRNGFGEISVNHPNHICVTVDLSATGWNENGSHKVFTVTGDAFMRVWARCTESVTGSGYFGIGYTGNAYILSEVAVSSVLVGYVAILDYGGAASWISPVSAGPITETTNSSTTVAQLRFTNGGDFVYNLTGSTSNGTVEFHCIWQPLSAGATVTAGSGGSL